MSISMERMIDLAKKPIEVFKSEEQFQEYAKEWQNILFLNDWFITFKLVDKTIFADDGSELWGYSSYAFSNSSAQITVYNGKTSSDGDSKNIAELTLVHELLHLKLEYMTDNDIIGEITQLEASLRHKVLEMMAKSLIMVKYGVSKDYFNDNIVFDSNFKNTETCRGVVK